MATTITLDEFFTTAEEKYGDLIVPASDADGAFEVRLQPLLRLPQERRDDIERLLINPEDEKDENGEAVKKNPVETLQEFIRLVANDEVNALRLVARIGDRADVLREIQGTWFEKTQAGEAEPSQS